MIDNDPELASDFLKANSAVAIPEPVEELVETAETKLDLNHIKSVIKTAEYSVFDGRLTVCTLKLVNGWIVVGHSSCASAENFVKFDGEKYAFENAVEQIWMLEGYLLKQRLYEAGK